MTFNNSFITGCLFLAGMKSRQIKVFLSIFISVLRHPLLALADPSGHLMAFPYVLEEVRGTLRFLHSLSVGI
jgi:hypothetical protein